MNRIISPNEARAKLDMNPYDGGDKFANPMIDPTITDPATGESNAPDRSTSEAAEPAAQAQLQHMVGVECNRIEQRGLRAKNFVEWVDGFYTRWQERLESTAGAEDCDAAGYCQRHKEALLAAADKQPSEFVAAVQSLLAAWRADGVKELASL